MCRSIVQLRRPERDVTEADIAAAARQFVRKVSGYRIPSKANTAHFEYGVQLGGHAGGGRHSGALRDGSRPGGV